jgi:uncharacterized protein YecE (DUF72 family)
VAEDRIFIGTSGYSYPHWKGVFYPQDLPQNKWLEYYCKFFNTVELNVTFYRLPQKAVFKSWYKRTPKEFYFVVKGSRFITHVKKLADVKEPLSQFFEFAKELKEKLAVVLWQLPPSMTVNLKKLESFCHFLQEQKMRQTFEFRNPSWFKQDVYDILKKYNFSLCLAHSPRWPLEEIITSDFAYLRFHGGESLYGSDYSDRELKDWAKKAKAWLKDGLDFYAYFNNDAQGFAIKNALKVKELLQ